MKKKLTLVIEESVIAQAKQLARRKKQSVSEMVEKYFVQQAKSEGIKPKSGSIVERLTGSAIPPNPDESLDSRRERILREKYG